MNTKHIHHDCIVAWAEGKPIQYWDFNYANWYDVSNPSWATTIKYRIKTEEKKKMLVKSLCYRHKLDGSLIWRKPDTTGPTVNWNHFPAGDFSGEIEA